MENESQVEVDVSKTSDNDLRKEPQDQGLTEIKENLQKSFVKTYMDDGHVFSDCARTSVRARRLATAIVVEGYRHYSNDNENEFEHYPPHRILKVKVSGGIVPTKYTDKVTGT